MKKRIDRRTFVKTAAAGSVAAAGLPLFGTSIALASEGDDDMTSPASGTDNATALPDYAPGSRGQRSARP